MVKEIELTCPPGQQDDAGALKGLSGIITEYPTSKSISFKNS